MASDVIESAIHESGTVETVEIPVDIAEALDGLEVSGPNPWEPWMDEVLRRYWDSRRQEDIAEIIGVGVKRCRKRARELEL